MARFRSSLLRPVRLATPPGERSRPPADLASRRALTLTLPTGTIIHRFYSKGHEPIHFDRSRAGRLNAPDGTYGVLYAAERADGAFAETFLRVPGRTLLPPDMLLRKGYVALRLRRDFTVIRLGGPGLVWLGATAEVTHGGLPYDVPQSWSAGLHEHPLAADGIVYSARHDDDEQCFALFDHAANRIEEVSRETNLDRGWFWELADKYGVGIAP